MAFNEANHLRNVSFRDYLIRYQVSVGLIQWSVVGNEISQGDNVGDFLFTLERFHNSFTMDKNALNEVHLLEDFYRGANAGE